MKAFNFSARLITLVSVFVALASGIALPGRMIRPDGPGAYAPAGKGGPTGGASDALGGGTPDAVSAPEFALSGLPVAVNLKDVPADQLDPNTVLMAAESELDAPIAATLLARQQAAARFLAPDKTVQSDEGLAAVEAAVDAGVEAEGVAETPRPRRTPLSAARFSGSSASCSRSSAIAPTWTASHERAAGAVELAVVEAVEVVAVEMT